MSFLACNGQRKLTVRFKYFTTKFSESIPINFKHARQINGFICRRLEFFASYLFYFYDISIEIYFTTVVLIIIQVICFNSKVVEIK